VKIEPHKQERVQVNLEEVEPLEYQRLARGKPKRNRSLPKLLTFACAISLISVTVDPILLVVEEERPPLADSIGQIWGTAARRMPQNSAIRLEKGRRRAPRMPFSSPAIQSCWFLLLAGDFAIVISSRLESFCSIRKDLPKSCGTPAF
jgi:hypothetical protein